MTSATKSAPGTQAGRFGMFAGVFTPNILTILGIILFLRIGWVVGQAGLWGALIIVLVANAISLLTGLSLSSIATSMQVKAGGNYYLISRTLGLEIGGAIGIPLFLSQAISVAFYIIGFTEALYTLEWVQQFDPRIISSIVALVFGIISYIGADFALKIQFFILAVLIAAIISFFAGGWDSFQAPLTQSAFSEGVSFWVVFAVFFPAVTGIEVGVSMSGDLKDPSRDIPRGTILSILVTAVVYILVVIWFATHSSRESLLNDNLAMQSVAIFPVLILAGVWASTLSSALGSILAAPRTLQAIALDRVVPRFFANKMGSPTEPRTAVITSTIIALVVIWLGDLNFVAPIISMFFLNTYGMVNLIASIEKLLGNPSFRPRFKIHWTLSLLGAIGCYGAMFLINTPATIVAILVSYGIYFLLQRRQISRTWGDVRSGILFAVARNLLLRLETVDLTVRNWHPNIIVFTGQPHNRDALVQLANWLSQGRGIITFFQLLTGNVDKIIGQGLRETARRNIRRFIYENQMEAFAEVEIVSNFKDGALAVAQAHGIGGLEANSIMMGWSRTADGQAMQMNLMRNLVGLHKSILLLHPDPKRGFGKQKRIHVWWQGKGGNADLMLLLTHLIRQHRDWQEAEVRLLRVIDNEKGREATLKHMEEFLQTVRVAAKPVVLTRSQIGEPISYVIRRNSPHADLTLLGMRLVDEADAATYAERMHTLVEGLGTVLLVHNAQRDDQLLSA
ncbi:MAG: amino acid permease [Chloroflexota bacterium]